MQNVLGLFGDCAAGRRGRTVRTTLLMSGLATALITAAHAQLVTWLGTLGGNVSRAYGVSDNGFVVGEAQNTSGQRRAFRWDNNTGMLDLGTLTGGDNSYASGVSADGSVVVGEAQNTSGQRRAFRWENNTGMLDLGTLGGYESWAAGVSEDGSVVAGAAQNTSGQWRAFRWDNNAGMLDLGTLPGGNESTAYRVSNTGVAVGYAQNNLGQLRAVRWTSSGIEDLNTIAIGLSPGSELQFATGISPNGRYIVGWGFNASTSRTEGWVMDLQVVPEPASVIALGSGLVSLLALRRRRVNR